MLRRNELVLGLAVLTLFLGGVTSAQARLDLGEVVVTATRTERLSSEVPVSVSVITSQEIEESNARNVGELLSEVPGIDYNPYGSLGAQAALLIRGSEADEVLVLLDGRPLNNPRSGLVNFSNLLLEDVERVEVLRGPASSLYGANALGGVVNIITKSAPQELTLDLATSYGTYNTRVYRFSQGKKVSEKVSYVLSGSLNSSDGHRNNSDYEAKNLSGKLEYNLSEDSKIILSANYYKGEVGVPGSSGWPLPRARQEDENENLNFLYRHPLFRIQVHQDESRMDYENPDMLMESSHEDKKTGIDFQSRFNWGEKHLFTFGFNSLRDEVESTDIGQKEGETSAFFVQDEVDLLDSGDLILTLGVRSESSSVYGVQTNPRLGILYRLGEDTRIRASLGKAYAAPNFNDLYWPDTGFVAGNPDLKPEEARAYDLGIEHRLFDILETRISLFRSDTEDMILWGPQDAADPFSKWVPLNVDSSSQGLELENELYLREGLSLFWNYTYLRARNKDLDKFLIYRPKNKGILGMRYARGKSKLSLTGECVGKRYTDSGNGEENVLEEYFLLGARVSHNPGEGIELFLSGENLLDRD